MQERSTQAGTAGGFGAFARHPATSAIFALGITQIFAWGTTLYALGVLGKPIAADTGWSQSLVFGGLTVGLLVSSAVSTYVGRLIDRRGGRAVMSIGSIVMAVGLRAAVPGHRPLRLSGGLGAARPRHAHDPLRCRLRRAGAGDAVARAPRHLLSDAVRRLCLSVFWPIGHALNAAYGWRTTLLIFAAINLLVCLPLHWLGLARRETAAARGAGRAPPPAAAARPARRSKARRVRIAMAAVRPDRGGQRRRVRRAGRAPGADPGGGRPGCGVAVLHRVAERRGPGGGPHLGPDAGARVAPDRRRPRVRRLHAAVVRSC